MSRLARMLLAALLACHLIGLSQPASAIPLKESDDHTINLDGAVKAFLFGLYFPHLSRDARILMGAPLGTVIPKHAGMGIGDLRLKLEGEHKEMWKWKLHFRTQMVVSSFPGALSALSTGTSGRPPRMLPFQTTAPRERGFEQRHEIDQLHLRIRYKKFDFIIGRQPISFGVGFIWQPADLVGTFSPLEIDREYKPGVDAFRMNIALGDFTELAVVFAAGGPTCTAGRLPSGARCKDSDVNPSIEHSTGLVRLRTTVGKWDVGVLTGWVRGDVVFGAFVTGAIKRTRLRAEAVFTYDLEADPNYAGQGHPTGADDMFVRAVIGFDYTFKGKRPLSIMAELYYNGFGVAKAKDYVTQLVKPRVGELAEVLNLGLLYLGAGLNWEPHEKVPLALLIMGNLTDPSMHISTTVTYKLGSESILVAGIFIPIGKAPSGDVLNLRLRSEFGLYPYMFYVQWKLYF